MEEAAQRELLYSEERIAEEVGRLAQEVSQAYAGEDLILVVVLKGAFLFAADLARRIDLPLVVEVVRLSSYSGMNSTGTVTMTQDLQIPIAGKNVLIVEDIVDTGISLALLRDRLLERQPKTLKICTLIDKKERRQRTVAPDFVGFDCPGGFLVGYGLDLDEKLRQLPAIYTMT
jgi:hypoxanthine phosphoribosyltransferase